MYSFSARHGHRHFLDKVKYYVKTLSSKCIQTYGYFLPRYNMCGDDVFHSLAILCTTIARKQIA